MEHMRHRCRPGTMLIEICPSYRHGSFGSRPCLTKSRLQIPLVRLKQAFSRSVLSVCRARVTFELPQFQMR